MGAALDYTRMPGPGDFEPPEDAQDAAEEHDEMLAGYLSSALELFIKTHPEPLQMRSPNGIRFGAWLLDQLKQLSAASADFSPNSEGEPWNE